MSDVRAALAAAVARLEEISGRLAAEDLEPGEWKALAEGALAASAEVNELLPRVIRAIEQSAESGISGGGDPEVT